LRIDWVISAVKMETLDGTEWNVLIAGTGLQQALLAL